LTNKQGTAYRFVITAYAFEEEGIKQILTWNRFEEGFAGCDTD
jgi:hypothetical protein